jgi:6-phosphogluconolactonase
MIGKLFVALLSLSTIWIAGAAAAESDAPAGVPAESCRIYIGTYTGRGSEGIYQARFSAATGKLDALSLAAPMENPSFLALHPSRPLLYAIGEVASFQGKKGGVVSAFAVDPPSGKLTLVNQQSTVGPGPCHVSVDATGRCVLVANYGGGSVASLPIDEDGRLGEAKSFFQHKGASVNRQRQEGPHAHGIYPDPANRFALVPDLGLDKVLLYRLDPANGTLAPHVPAFVASAAGAGPRHLAFHPGGDYAFAINELNSTLTSFRYDAKAGRLETLESLSTLPKGVRPTGTTAEVAVHPSGRFVYGSNRGHDSIVAYALDVDSGKLRQVGHQSTGGKTPRSFAIDPSGRWLLAANQDSDNIVVLRIDPQTGKLSATGHSLKVSMPVCIVAAMRALAP